MAKQTLTNRKGGKFDGGDNRLIKMETTDNQTMINKTLHRRLKF
jgi:hypothetical protein